MNRVAGLFGALVVVQAAHSLEEYAGRLWEVFPPARAVCAAVSNDPARGFVVFNLALAAFGLAALVALLVDAYRARPVLWLWVAIELMNGVGHPLWSAMRRGYTPGVATAPLLLALAITLARELRRSERPSSRGARVG